MFSGTKYLQENGNDTVVLFASHICTPIMHESLKALDIALANLSELVLLFHQDTEVCDLLTVYNNHVFDNRILDSLNYTPLENHLVPGSNHFSLLDFFLQNRNFEYYWYIEHDVCFNCDWAIFFKSFNGDKHSDFITSHIRQYRDEPNWYWWPTLRHSSFFIPYHLRLRSFNPIYRISNAALNYLNSAMVEGWEGHHEVMIPTLLELEGFNIRDFGGDGQYVLPGDKNRFYESRSSDMTGKLENGSMRYRPIIEKTEMVSPLLYHPFK